VAGLLGPRDKRQLPASPATVGIREVLFGQEAVVRALERDAAADALGPAVETRTAPPVVGVVGVRAELNQNAAITTGTSRTDDEERLALRLAVGGPQENLVVTGAPGLGDRHREG